MRPGRDLHDQFLPAVLPAAAEDVSHSEPGSVADDDEVHHSLYDRAADWDVVLWDWQSGGAHFQQL